MEFRVLGPLEVLRDGRPVPIRGRIHPRLLAVLALDAGGVVLQSTVMAALWEDEPPATARRQVQNAVSGLRGRLDGVAIEAVGLGYRLAVDPATVDARRFESAIAAAGRHRRDGDPGRALATLREALALWRGPALAGLTGGLAAHARNLEEKRLASIAERVELELELGQQPSIAELRELLDRNGYQQRIAGLLMLALYREGRGPEALTLYQALKARLAEELGIDPDPALRERYAAILREDPALAAASPAVAAPDGHRSTAPIGAPVPAQLPADIAGFTGRRAQLTELDRLLAEDGTAAVLSTVTGTGGAGKTALAVHWAHRNRDRFPDGQLYLNLRGFDRAQPLPASEALSHLLHGLGVSGKAVPADAEAAATLFRSLVAERRILVLLDNARDENQVRPLLPGGGGNFALITSRNRLTGLTALHDARPVAVDLMSRDESLAVLGKLLGAARLDAETEAAQRLAELCCDLPLALRIAGAKLAARPDLPIAEYARELAGPDRLDLLAVDSDPHFAVAATFSRSVQALPEDVRRFFARLGTIPGGDFTEALATTVADAAVKDGRRCLAALVSGHLLENHRPRRYRMHDLVRQYCRQQTDKTVAVAERSAAADRLVAWYGEHETAATQAEYGNIVAAMRTWRDHPRCFGLVTALAHYANAGLFTSDMDRHLLDAHALAHHRGSPFGLFVTTSALGELAARTGDITASLAHLRQAVAHSLEHDGDASGIARGDLGVRYGVNGMLSQGEDLIQQALRAATASGDTRSAEFHVSNLSSLQIVRGKYGPAETQLRRLLTELPESGDGLSPVSVHTALAELYLATGRFGEARDAIDSGLSLARDKAMHRYESINLRLRAELDRRAMHDRLSALDDADRAVAIARDQRLRKEEIDAICERAAGYCELGQPRRAAADLGLLATVVRDNDNPKLRALATATLAMIHIGLGDLGTARGLAAQAVDRYAAMPIPLLHARALLCLATAHFGLGEARTARRQRVEALAILTRLDAPEAVRLRRELDAADQSGQTQKTPR